MPKPNCYACKHRRNVPGDAHSVCGALPAELIFDAMALFLLTAGQVHAGKVVVTAHPHGVRSGWCSWPINFDPVWIDQCSLYAAKEEARHAA